MSCRFRDLPNKSGDKETSLGHSSVLARLGFTSAPVNIEGFNNYKSTSCFAMLFLLLLHRRCCAFDFFCHYILSFSVTLLLFSLSYSALSLIFILITINLLLLSSDSASNLHSSLLYTLLLKTGSAGGNLFACPSALLTYQQQHILCTLWGAAGHGHS